MKSLCEIMNASGSDKNTYHSYGPVYEEFFSQFRDDATAIFEFGVLEGASVRAWREYFTKAHIYGVDAIKTRLVNEDRITTWFQDTKDRDGLLALKDKLPPLDIIIDDCSHVISEQIWVIAAFWSKLKPGGLFIVEDIAKPEYLELFQCFQGWSTIDRRHVKNQHDDMMVVIKKPRLEFAPIHHLAE